MHVALRSRKCPFTNREQDTAVEAIRHNFNRIAWRNIEAGNRLIYVMPTPYTKEIVSMTLIAKSDGYATLKDKSGEIFGMTADA